MYILYAPYVHVSIRSGTIHNRFSRMYLGCHIALHKECVYQLRIEKTRVSSALLSSAPYNRTGKTKHCNTVNAMFMHTSNSTNFVCQCVYTSKVSRLQVRLSSALKWSQLVPYETSDEVKACISMIMNESAYMQLEHVAHACAVEHANVTTCGPHCAEYFGMCTMYCVLAAQRVTVV